jgi:hypothetical protein
VVTRLNGEGPARGPKVPVVAVQPSAAASPDASALGV